MKYKVKFPTKSLAKKFYKTLESITSEKIKEKIIKETLDLSNNPRPYGIPKVSPPVEIYDYVAQHRLRIGNYRVLYDVDDRKKVVWILALRKRSERTYRR